MVPWHVTVFSRTYLKEALQDQEYLTRTWRVTPKWREHMVTRLQRLHPTWKILGESWLPWIWVDTGDPNVATAVYTAALESGCPVRHGARGYGMPNHLRIAVRRPYDFAVLHQALLQLECKRSVSGLMQFGTFADVHPSVVDTVALVHVDDLRPHEEVTEARAVAFQHYLSTLSLKILPAIIVCSQTQVVIDGHHRLHIFKQAGMSIVPAVFVCLDHEDVLVSPPNRQTTITKDDVIFSAMRGKLFPPKSTQFMVRSRGGQLMPIIVLAPQIVELHQF